MENPTDSNRDLHRLIYHSQATLTPATTLEEEFPRILATSRERNTEDHITGALLAYEGWFLQVLEGPHPKVVETFERIRRDPRHRSVTLLQAEPLYKRQFANWSMCGRHISVRDEVILDILGTKPKFSVDRLTPANALKLLEAITRVRGTYSRSGNGP